MLLDLILFDKWADGDVPESYFSTFDKKVEGIAFHVIAVGDHCSSSVNTGVGERDPCSRVVFYNHIQGKRFI
jgi:hypothetical protein